MACLGIEPGVAGWKAQTNPLSYGGTPSLIQFNMAEIITKRLKAVSMLLHLLKDFGNL